MTIVRVNGSVQYTLINWTASSFKSSLQLLLYTSDLQQVCTDFRSIQTLEVYRNGNLYGYYTTLDSYSEITYLDSVYDTENARFVSAIRVTLTKADIAEQIQRIDAQINPVVDVENLSLEELRDYKLGIVSDACQEDVYAGTTIELSDGSSYTFSYTAQDQTNWDELMLLAMIAPSMTQLPYHGNGSTCRFFSREDVITICATLLMRKTQIITYCNQLNLYINTLNDRDALLAVEYGMTLPEEYQNVINSIISQTSEQLQAFMNSLN